MIRRDKSLNELIRFKDKDLIKVVTGVREYGKWGKAWWKYRSII